MQEVEVKMTEGERIFFTHYIEYVDQRLHRFVVKLILAFAILGFCVAGTVYYISVVAKDNTDGLCALRHDAQERIDQTNDFLDENPQGTSGISRSQLLRSRANSQRTFDALEGIDCER